MRKLLPLCLVAALILAACQPSPSITVDTLLCEGLDNPMGIDIAPRLSWQLKSDIRNVQQTAYRIIVASTPDKLKAGEADIWDSGEVQSGQSLNVLFGGQVKARTAYFWKVKTITNHGPTPWSQPAQWTAGLINPSDWTAQWTGLDKSYPNDALEGKTRLAARYFRKEFTLDKKVEKATLYVTGLGFYECTINGQPVGNQTMSPTPTDYTKTVKYNAFDVTGNLSASGNAIGIILGNGRYFSMRQPGVRHFGYPKMIAQLEITYSDGTTTTIASNDSWKATADGPILSNNEFDGEEYDARKEMPGWDSPGFNDANWEQAQAVDPPGGTLEGQINPNIAHMDFVRPVSIKELSPGVYIMDMGQNMVGRVAMEAKGPEGQEIKLRFAETLKPDGALYLDNIRGALVTDRYTLKGTPSAERWEPLFTYHGFRYVEITGYPGAPTTDNFTGRVIYDRMDPSGTFETSNPTVNQLYKNAYWGIRGNYRGMPTDCPQRDERMGWLGDRAVGSLGESFIFNNNNLYAKWLADIEQAQREDGSVPDVAPNYWSVYTDNMTWAGAYIIIADMVYRQYDNIEPIRKHYPSMKKWLTYMRTKYLVDGIMTKDTYGDWCMPPELPHLVHSKDPARQTSGAVLSTAFYYRLLRLMENFATLLDQPGDAQQFAAEAVIIRQAFNDKYYKPDSAFYDNNTVTANILPLCYGMAPDGQEQAIFNNIVSKTMGEFNGHVSTGLVGIQWLMRGLSLYGRPDIAWRIASNRTYPSWGYMIEKGATTIWELWNGDTADPSMNSHNHVMLLGDLVVWFYENLAGIRNDPSGAGFRKIRMKPQPVEGLQYVNASYHSPYGRIESSWKKEAGSFKWNIEIPCNSSAIVHIPLEAGSTITESGRDPSSDSSLKPLGEDNGYAVYEIGSGSYHFEASNPK
jgi:alpha-L-rhamnosidase